MKYSAIRNEILFIMGRKKLASDRHVGVWDCFFDAGGGGGGGDFGSSLGFVIF